MHSGSCERPDRLALLHSYLLALYPAELPDSAAHSETVKAAGDCLLSRAGGHICFDKRESGLVMVVCVSSELLGETSACLHSPCRVSRSLHTSPDRNGRGDT